MKTIVWFGLVLSAISAAGNVIKVKARQKATIECGVNTYSNILMWYHEADLIISTTKKSFPRKGPSEIVSRSKVVGDTTLMIQHVKEEDGGEFTCTADGTPRKHRLLVVSVSVSPSSELDQYSKAMFNCQVKGLGPDSTVQWKMPNGVFQPSTVNISQVALSHSGTWVCTFSHAGETYSENLDIKVKAFQSTTSSSQISKDNVKPTCCVSTSTFSGSLEVLGLSCWIWVAIGVGGLVVVFLMVLVIVLCKRIKRRKKRLLKIKNAGQQLNPRQYCQCDHPTAAAKPQQGRRREKPY